MAINVDEYIKKAIRESEIKKEILHNTQYTTESRSNASSVSDTIKAMTYTPIRKPSSEKK